MIQHQGHEVHEVLAAGPAINGYVNAPVQQFEARCSDPDTGMHRLISP